MTKPRPITLDADGLRRLRAAIAHWGRMARGQLYPGEVPDASCCALCERWILDDCATSRTDRCPVYQATGRRACERTPYRSAYRAAYPLGGGSRLSSPEFIRAAKRELAFLRDLLDRAEEVQP